MNVSKKICRASITIASVVVLLFFYSCKEEQQETIDIKFDAESVPMMQTDSVTIMVSDSGFVRYKVKTKRYEIFERSKEPRWYFPEGVYLEKYSTTFAIEAVLKADTVWNYTQKRLWKLKGHVFVQNAKGVTFKSEELFVDDRTQKVYSDKYIEIQEPAELLLKGKGFTSNQQMTEYQIRNPYDSEFFIDENKNTSESEEP